MKRAVLAVAVVGMLLPGVVGAAPDGGPRTSVLVMFAEDAPEAVRTSLVRQVGGIVTGRIDEIDVVRLSVLPGADSVLAASRHVVAVEYPRDLRLMARAPNDPLVKLQWGLRRLGAFDAWKVGKKLDDVQVAVLDTGVDAAHVDLSERVLAGFDYLEIDDDTYDDEGHGTHVAGIIAANAGNRKGVAGIAPNASIIPMKVCTSSGSCDIFMAYLAAVDAVQRGADVLNLSLGGAGPCDEIGQTVFDWVRDQGALTVVSAGNSGSEGNPSISPANCDNTLGVGATDIKDRKAEFSSFGNFVDIAAPGVGIWSTYPPLVSITSPHIGYWPADGTSMAAPFVAGAAAVLKGLHPDWTPEQIADRLMSTARDAGPKGRDDFFGKGILDLLAAVR